MYNPSRGDSAREKSRKKGAKYRKVLCVFNGLAAGALGCVSPCYCCFFGRHGRTRTDSLRILSPLRLPFRHAPVVLSQLQVALRILRYHDRIGTLKPVTLRSHVAPSLILPYRSEELNFRASQESVFSKVSRSVKIRYFDSCAAPVPVTTRSLS
jgi:hypothetical protein